MLRCEDQSSGGFLGNFRRPEGFLCNEAAFQSIGFSSGEFRKPIEDTKDDAKRQIRKVKDSAVPTTNDNGAPFWGTAADLFKAISV